ncbi:hypothetical protein PHYPSEUDO_013859 [Phytophthora pseudosyringae]|uniref:Uncharacterized protein n=1 Tax=Phytophthora pseudosyringae TaxID=221518 RepID=A0A8T1W762_9STRA|nr:hypothetical protein PHYPSEUDO_013859 [Phytophthora pseudosyringae]
MPTINNTSTANPIAAAVNAADVAMAATGAELTAELEKQGQDAGNALDGAAAAPRKKRRKVLRTAESAVQQQQRGSVKLKSGAEMTLQVRQHFEDRTQAKEYIQDFALAQGKRARLDPKTSGGKNFTFVCNSQTPCTFVTRPEPVHLARPGC